MPTYEYICDACGNEFEKFQSIMSKPERVCPRCKARKARRKLGIGSAVIFKGSGFYETDYRSENYTKAAEADRKSEQGASGAEKNAAGKPTESPAPAKPGAQVDPVSSQSNGQSSTAKGSNDSSATTASKDASPASGSLGGSNTPASKAKQHMATKAVHPSRVGRGKGNIRRKKQ